MEISDASHVDIYGVKCEGSNTVLWVRDSSDVNLYGFGGAADAFPNKTFYPADFRQYTVRIHDELTAHAHGRSDNLQPDHHGCVRKRESS
jgi:hypothetical protein